MNPKIFVIAIIGAFAVMIGVLGFSGSSIISDVSSGGFIFSPSSPPPQISPLEIELESLSILEVTEKAAFLEIKFKVSNPNFKSILLQIVKYELFENNIRITAGQIGERAQGMIATSNYYTILNENPTVLTDKITLKNTGNTPELWSALTNNTPQWRITGEAFYNLSSMTSGEENITPFEFTR